MSQHDKLIFKADPRDKSPLYMQLANKLGQDIRDGHYRQDEALPSERQLAETLNISRVTARSAINLLEEKGLIIRRHGSGNYIAPRLEQPLSHITSFSEELRRRGYVPSSRWLNRGITTAKVDEQTSLGLSSNEKVARLERLRLADGIVMAYEVSVMPQHILPDPTAFEGSLYAHLLKTNKAPTRALQHIRAVNAHSLLADRLDIPERQAVLFITRVGYLESGVAMELTHTYCRSDYYYFVAEMRRE